MGFYFLAHKYLLKYVGFLKVDFSFFQKAFNWTFYTYNIMLENRNHMLMTNLVKIKKYITLHCGINDMATLV